METEANLMDLIKLQSNTQYAFRVSAKTESGLKSGLSETIIAWTEAPTPVMVSPPRLDPPGPIIEGSMMIVRCDATGNPMPIILILVNGNVVYKEQTRHASFKLDYIQRNISSISCLASNSENNSTHKIIPAQSHVDIRVRCELIHFCTHNSFKIM